MPNLNEFFDKTEIIKSQDFETIYGVKPCSKCEANAEEALWDPSTLTLSWKCINGHNSQYRIN